MGGELNFNLISVYAPNSPRERATVWNELADFADSSILCGDFNMVEFSEDRHLGIGYVVQGMEETEWYGMVGAMDLTDISNGSRLTWSNIQGGNAFKAARLDRFYMFDLLLERWPNSHCSLNRSIQISDHCPLILKACSIKDSVKSGWFHADASLFHYDEVRQDVTNIFKSSFVHCMSPSRAWSQAVSQTQVRLAQYMKMAKLRRGSRRAALDIQIKKLKSASPEGSNFDSLRDLKN